MAGKSCPNSECEQQTFFLVSGSDVDRKCSKCGYTMKLPRNGGKGGRGKKCVNCGKSKVFKDPAVGSNKLKCNGCGAEYQFKEAEKKNRNKSLQSA